jgi:hypothetical protein
MDFKSEFLSALQSGMGHDALLELVRRHKDQGLGSDEAYYALEEIWLQCDYDSSDKESPIRDELEYVMEKVWFQVAHAG